MRPNDHPLGGRGCCSCGRAEPAFRRFGFHEVIRDEWAFNGHTFTVVRMAKRLDGPVQR